MFATDTIYGAVYVGFIDAAIVVFNLLIVRNPWLGCLVFMLGAVKNNEFTSVSCFSGHRYRCFIGFALFSF